MNKIKKFFIAHKIFKIFAWVILILVGLFIILLVFRTFHYFDVQKTNDQVNVIHSTKLSLDDVTGQILPSDPGIEADKTIQGIDANNNGIRDDVEIAIYKEYPNSAKTRAVLLQYALVLQMETTQSINNTTLSTEIMREETRANTCLGDILVPRKAPDFSRGYDEVEKIYSYINFIENIQFNTKERKDYRETFLKNVRSFSDIEESCDIDLSKLPN